MPTRGQRIFGPTCSRNDIASRYGRIASLSARSCTKVHVANARLALHPISLSYVVPCETKCRRDLGRAFSFALLSAGPFSAIDL
jgi:hypothetical protein